MGKRSLFNPDGKPIANCGTHGRLPGAVICPKCLELQNERIQGFVVALQNTPEMLDQLFKEGRHYLAALELISANGCTDSRCEVVAGKWRHHRDCPVEFAELAIKSGKAAGGLLSPDAIPENVVGDKS